MDDMVSRVVQVITEGSPFMNHNRVMNRAFRKTPQRKITIRRPSKITGEKDEFEKDRERRRKDAKANHPNTSLSWDGQRWSVRQRQKEEIEKKLQHLTEIVRTLAVGASLAKIKGFANKADSGIQKLRSLGSSLQKAKDETERNKIQGEIVIVDAGVLQALRSMEMYSSLLTTAGTVGLERTLIKKLKQRKRK